MLAKVKKLKIKDDLLNFGKTQKFFESVDFTGDPVMDKFILGNSNAFLIAVICDYGIPAQKAWQFPFLIKKRLGHFDIKKIAKMKQVELAKIISQKPNLHRFPSDVAKYIILLSLLLVEKYNGHAKNIWSDRPLAEELEHRLLEFSGIGQKKASMAVNILSRDFEVPMKNKNGINVSYDIHVKRVFSRSGLSNSDSQIDVIVSARELNPGYPGALDFPAWIIGRKFCHPQNPECDECPLIKDCKTTGEQKVKEIIEKGG